MRISDWSSDVCASDLDDVCQRIGELLEDTACRLQDPLAVALPEFWEAGAHLVQADDVHQASTDRGPGGKGVAQLYLVRVRKREAAIAAAHARRRSRVSGYPGSWIVGRRCGIVRFPWSAPLTALIARAPTPRAIGRATCRDRGCQYV